MGRKEILDTFYNHIIKEASTGKVDCYFIYRLIFITRIDEEKTFYQVNNQNDDLFIPTLLIKNKQVFDELLVEYVNKALKFYDNSNFEEEILFSDDKEKAISKEKVLMTLLWSNATIEDFNDPCTYLRRRINFFELGDFEQYLEPKIVGYSNILNAYIEFCIEKNKISYETPYSFRIFLRDVENGNRIYEFPRIYSGIANNRAYIYAIQNHKNKLIDEKYSKTIERKMYKVNAGLEVEDDFSCNYDLANLKDITPSFLVATNIMCGLLNHHHINKIQVISLLISRWNAKMLVLDYKKKKLSELEIKENYDNYLAIERNLVDKFLRLFRRLAYHHSSIGIMGYPMEGDSNLNMFIYEQEDVCNNLLLEETYHFLSEKTKRK